MRRKERNRHSQEVRERPGPTAPRTSRLTPYPSPSSTDAARRVGIDHAPVAGELGGRALHSDPAGLEHVRRSRPTCRSRAFCSTSRMDTRGCQLRDDAEDRARDQRRQPQAGLVEHQQRAWPSARDRPPASGVRRPTGARHLRATFAQAGRARTSLPWSARGRASHRGSAGRRPARGCPRRSSRRKARASPGPGSSRSRPWSRPPAPPSPCCPELDATAARQEQPHDRRQHGGLARRRWGRSR